MSSDVDFDKRISVLENSMEWAQGSINEIKRDLESLKNGQFQILDRLVDLQTRMEKRFSSIEERFFSQLVHIEEKNSSQLAHIDEKTTSQIAHIDERISSLQAHTDQKFVEVHKEIANIHRAISSQTKWILITILAAASLASILHPLMSKLL